MITSGYMIGQIIDEFALLGDRIKLRNRVHLFDLSIYVENFFRDIINIIDDCRLDNLISVRSNEPGLDLGDKQKRIAFQVTSDKTGSKVIHTLQRITEEQRNDYDRFIVLIVSEKQQKYDSVVTALTNRSNSESDVKNDSTSDEENNPSIHPDIPFDIDTDILDLTDVARKVVGLPLDKIQELHQLIQKQMAKVRIELEVPDNDGNYETSGYKKWEPLAKPNIGNGFKFASWEERFHEIKYNSLDGRAIEVKEAAETFSQKLYVLPRITREFYAMLNERATFMDKRLSEYPSLYFDTVTRSYPGAQTELDLLVAQDLISINHENDRYDNPLPVEIGIKIFNIDYTFAVNYHTYVVNENLSFRKILGNLDFSHF